MIAGIDEKKLKRAFLDEVEEILEHLDQALLELEKQPDNTELLNEVFRFIHSLKSEAAMLGFTSLSGLAHKIEDVFDKLRNREMSITQVLMDTILSATDQLHEIISVIEKGGRDDDFNVAEIVNLLKSACGETITLEVSKEDVDEPVRKRIEFEKRHEFSCFEKEQLIEAGERKEEFYRLTCRIDDECPMKYARAYLLHNNLEKIVNVVKAIPSMDLEQESDENYATIVFYITASCDEKEIYKAVEIDQVQKAELLKLDLSEYMLPGRKDTEQNGRAGTAALSLKRVERNSIRVGTKKLDELWSLVGELIINKSQLSKIAKIINSLNINPAMSETVEAAVDKLDKITDGIQQAMMETRMVPISVIFNKLPRLVRDLSKKLGKNVKLTITGEETEIDRSIVEQLSEPITHIIRNSLDHGIEFSDVRVAKSKPSEGTITVSASQEGGNIILQISDDGSGFDLKKIEEKALEKGLITNGDTAYDKIVRFIFLPGFSTKDEVTDLSGRGVGMDVVATKIKDELHGDVSLNTDPDKGSTVTITLPLTLTILNAVIIRSRDHLYAIPVNKTEETVEVLNTEIRYDNGRAMYNYRDEEVPVIYLDSLLGKRVSRGEENYGVIIRHGSMKGCLFVDMLVEELDIVIKPIDDILNSKHLFSGISVLGDGSIVYILDTSSILERL
ncbi:MAG: chemotaxis protein CheA [Spirochaetes bacterium]|nr:chemotaxis protein CheA [Spirochaetota bacterium]